MISPEGFIQEHIDKSYAELLRVRDELIAEIRDFEKCRVNPIEITMSPSSDVIYQCNLEYLGKLCELISEKYNREFVWREEKKCENYIFDINLVIGKLKSKREIFVSEADFQLELAWIIKEQYPDALVRLEYCPYSDTSMHIDILVIIDNQWIPIELKYKTKSCNKKIGSEAFALKHHGAKDINCYLYLKDLQRIESIRDTAPEFLEGYTIFLTNDLSYIKKPAKPDCVYKDFSLEDGITKQGTLHWSENTCEGTKKNCEEPIVLKCNYPIKWQEYCIVDDTNTGRFVYLVNKIERSRLERI